MIVLNITQHDASKLVLRCRACISAVEAHDILIRRPRFIWRTHGSKRGKGARRKQHREGHRSYTHAPSCEDAIRLGENKKRKVDTSTMFSSRQQRRLVPTPTQAKNHRAKLGVQRPQIASPYTPDKDTPRDTVAKRNQEKPA
ncbi:unnamed protein product, partial [Ectocarpus sp. 13 AM-2016]